MLLLTLALLGRFAEASDRPLKPVCERLKRVEITGAWPFSCAGCDPQVAFEVALRLVREGEEEEGRASRRNVRLDQHFVARLRASYGRCAPPILRRVGTWLERLQVEDPELESPRQKLSARALSAVAYRLRSKVVLSLALERRVADLALRFHRRTGRKLIITSGRRDPIDQARAMYVKLRLGARLFKLYRNTAALREVVAAYRKSRRRRLTRRETIAAMAAVVAEQVQRRVFLSEHLKDNAVDLRIRGLRRGQIRLLERLAKKDPGVRIKREGRPPHLHLAFLE